MRRYLLVVQRDFIEQRGQAELQYLWIVRPFSIVENPCCPKIGTTQSSSLAVIEVQRSAKPSMTTDGIGIRCHGGGQLD